MSGECEEHYLVGLLDRKAIDKRQEEAPEEVLRELFLRETAKIKESTERLLSVYPNS